MKSDNKVRIFTCTKNACSRSVRFCGAVKKELKEFVRLKKIYLNILKKKHKGAVRRWENSTAQYYLGAIEQAEAAINEIENILKSI